MSSIGGQASSAAFPAAESNIIWLPGVERQNAPEPHEARGSIAAQARPVSLGWPIRALAATAAAAGQAAALPLIVSTDGRGDPWMIAAVFGMAAALFSWTATPATGKFANSQSCAQRAAPQDLALHDAFTLALIAAASAALGSIGALLLLPAGTALSLMIRRIARKRAADEQDLTLLLIVAIAVAGLCQPFGVQAWAIAGVALAAAVIVKAGQSCLRAPQRRRMWHVWGMSASLCAAVAFAGQVRTGLPAAPPVTVLMPFIAGAIYGFGAGAGARILSRGAAQAVSAAVPFLGVAVEIVLSGNMRLAQIAAAVVLAGVLAGTIRRAAPARHAANDAPEVWPIGWPRWL
ncbi:MAG: hypothetical protein ACLPWS_14245 [Rhodomicrobium sp.]